MVERGRRILKKIACSLLGMALVCGATLPAAARDITGKVVAVFHEPVVVNAKTLDKVSVTVNSCASGQWETFSYSPGVVSDDNSLGFLFTDLANSARLMVSKSQYMNTVSGHVTLAVNEQNVVQRTTFWGYNWECGRDLDAGPAPAGQPMGGMNNNRPAATTTTQPAQQPKPSINPLGGFRNFGF